jgi:hypothetical protein
MGEYFSRVNVTPSPTVGRDNSFEPSIENLATEYGLNEEDDMIWSDAATGEDRTVEQEFQAYVTEPRGADVPILQYWKVSLFRYYLFHAADQNFRCTKCHILRYTPWPWITYQYKRHQCRAKGSSHQAVRRIPRKGIVLMAY